MRRAGVRTFAEAENYEADRKRRALEEGGARGDRAHARHRGRADEDDPAILAQVKRRLACMRSSRGTAFLHAMQLTASQHMLIGGPIMHVQVLF